MTSEPAPPDRRKASSATASPRTRSRTAAVTRKVGVLLVGVPVLALGIALVPLPGPGTLVILAGLAILSLEFDWADRLAQRIKDGFMSLIHRISGRG